MAVTVFHAAFRGMSPLAEGGEPAVFATGLEDAPGLVAADPAGCAAVEALAAAGLEAAVARLLAGAGEAGAAAEPHAARRVAESARVANEGNRQNVVILPTI